MAFKQDDDFLRFITMGAAGSAAVSRHLRETHGHRTIELERYAMANKIWATKIKRLRLADMVCLDCGLRIEARAKSELKVRMSHSNTKGREWDAGQRDPDLCAFVPWANGAPAGEPEYFEVGAMREAAGYATLGSPKAPSEGAERDMTWPARVASRDSVVEAVDWDEAKVRIRPAGGNRQTVYLRGNVPTYIYVEEGDELRGGSSFIMGCLDRPATLDCTGKTWDYVAALQAEDDIDRYVAVKTAGLRGGDGVEQLLLDIAEDDDEDERIRLEAWGSLARLDPPAYTRMVIARAEKRTAGDRHTMAMAMEAIFILSELRTALAGIGDLPDELLPEAAGLLRGNQEEAASGSALLAMQGDRGIECLLAAARAEGQSAAWASAALGTLAESDVRRVAGGRLRGDVERALVPMWTQRRSWLQRQQLDTPLRFMQRQTVRHLA